MAFKDNNDEDYLIITDIDYRDEYDETRVAFRYHDNLKRLLNEESSGSDDMPMDNFMEYIDDGTYTLVPTAINWKKRLDQ